MAFSSRQRTAVRWLAAGAGLAAGAYGAMVAVGWLRYGRAEPAVDQFDPLLDHFMPEYEVVERHAIRVNAPAAVTFKAAEDQDLLHSPLVRAIFKAREVAMGAKPDSLPQPRGLLAQMLGIGWGILALEPDHEIVVGAVTQPWRANVVFRPLPPDDFAAFGEPGFVKIVWTLRADPIGTGASVFRTETRAVATDATARARFRRYWAFVSPGVSLIRTLSLQPLKREAERRERALRSS